MIKRFGMVFGWTCNGIAGLFALFATIGLLNRGDATSIFLAIMISLFAFLIGRAARFVLCG